MFRGGFRAIAISSWSGQQTIIFLYAVTRYLPIKSACRCFPEYKWSIICCIGTEHSRRCSIQRFAPMQCPMFILHWSVPCICTFRQRVTAITHAPIMKCISYSSPSSLSLIGRFCFQSLPCRGTAVLVDSSALSSTSSLSSLLLCERDMKKYLRVEDKD